MKATVRRPQDVSRAVKSMRMEKGMTQAQLAEALGVSRKWVIELEAGNVPLAVRNLLSALSHLDAHLEIEQA